MTIPLLTTKLNVPPPRPHMLSRPRLMRRLDGGLRLGHRLTLISAPAGYGKTTLLSEWARKREGDEATRRRSEDAIQQDGESADGRSVAWLSLGEEDSDLVRFWTYLVAALQRVEAHLGEGIVDALRSPQRPPVEAFLTPLINQVAALPRGLVLVLDDYHLITNGAIHEGLAFLLDHLPENAHLAVATRADPPLPLARLRGRGQLTELRQADLRFTPEEAAAFLERVFGLDLSPEEVAALEERTEGWITGLQLAALSMRGQDDVSGFVSAFTGSHRYILDYLTEEVLRRQPEDIRHFLLHTSVLDRLSGSLCDAVLRESDRATKRQSDRAIRRQSDKAARREGDEARRRGGGGANRRGAGLSSRAVADSQAVLEHLEATNLFLVPLDERRAWYRYHRLFADLLRARLGELYAHRVPELHRRASAWYEREGMLDEAMKHVIAAGDLARAAHIAASHGRSLLMRGELTTLLRWIAALPEREIETSAPICVTHAWALLLTGQLAHVEARVQRVEQLVPADSPLLGDVAAIRAYVASQRGDVPRTVDLAERALERLPASKLGERAVVFFVLGGAHLLRGDVAAAVNAFGQAADVGQEGGNLHLALPALNSLTAIQLGQGELWGAKATAEEAIGLVTGPDGQPLPIGAGAVSALAELAYEWNELDEALVYARQGVELARLWGNLDTLGFGTLTLAQVLLAMGRLDEASAALRDAGRLSQEASLFPTFLPALRAAQARFWLEAGDLAAAGQWAQGETPATTGLTDMERSLTLAQVHWAVGRLDEALDVATGLLEMARMQGLEAWLVRGMALEALILRAQGREARALNALVEALTLAEPGGYVRSFVDRGPALAVLLQEAAAQGVTPDYVNDLLSAFDEDVEVPMRKQPLIEPLSARELEVLGLVAEGLSNREVGRRLHIAESTVKSHLNAVYGKLAVDNRTQAAAKGRALKLL